MRTSEPRSRNIAPTRSYSDLASSRRLSAAGCSRISERKSSPLLPAPTPLLPAPAPAKPAPPLSGGSVEPTPLLPAPAPAKPAPPLSGGSDEHTFDLERVVEDDDVRGKADVEPPGLGEVEHARRHTRGGRERLLERRAELGQVADRFEHRQHASRQQPLRRADGAVLDAELDAAEAVRAAARPRGRDGIRDERDAASGCAP